MLTQPLRQFIEFFWPWAEFAIPGLAVFLPRDAVMSIVDAVEIGLNKKLVVDVKTHNIFGILSVIKEITEAILTRTPCERREAVWSLLEFLTNIETHMTKDEFLTYTSQVAIGE